MNVELKKLSRKELLQLLINQTKKIEQLEEELVECRTQLENRRIIMKECGTMAEAALKINGVFEAIDEAAKQYLANVKKYSYDLEKKNYKNTEEIHDLVQNEESYINEEEKDSDKEIDDKKEDDVDIEKKDDLNEEETELKEESA